MPVVGCISDPKVAFGCQTQRANQLANSSEGHGAFKSAHMLYLHAQKTGGSTLECATEGNPLSVRWTNMGHTSRAGKNKKNPKSSPKNLAAFGNRSCEC